MKNMYMIILMLPLLGCSSHLDKQESAMKGQSSGEIQENLSAGKETAGQPENAAGREKVILDVPLIKQNPELKYGCEVTSLAMMLQYAGVKADKMDLYHKIKKDPDPIIKSNRDIVQWGNPAHGFVGDMTGKQAGYAAFDKPIFELALQYLPGRAVNLTGKSFEDILSHVSQGYPAVVWTTGDYRLPDRWESWTHEGELIKTPLDLHAVTLVGYDSRFVYINDPLSGKKQVRITKEKFKSSWLALKSRAISYR
ncbi:C39 family peptidase [Bacillus infantis]|uniref:C39 family peptidase n=1 Tax=Bacillus infantis TaxID=324767 RepID=UPI003CF09EF5